MNAKKMKDGPTEKIEIWIEARPQNEACQTCGIFPPRTLYTLTREKEDAPFTVQVASQSLEGWTDRSRYGSLNSPTVERICPKCEG